MADVLYTHQYFWTWLGCNDLTGLEVRWDFIRSNGIMLGQMLSEMLGQHKLCVYGLSSIDIPYTMEHVPYSM